jgi:hypothetical protein
MIFPDSFKLAGFFKENILKKTLDNLSEFEDFEKSGKFKMPVSFRIEIIELLKS